MSATINIQRAVESDVITVYNFLCELEEEKLDFNAFLEIFNRNLKSPDCHYFMAFDKAKCVGYASVHTQWLLHHCGKVGEIQEMFVVDNYRSKGVGSLLIQELMNVAERENFKILEVTANKKRVDTHRFYESKGLEPTHFKFVKKYG
ncbi:GNAT family N-acetyltransferase [Runella sp. CRIBMP]|uniref:GNAT family N-acetyltransferase n=1 Tax=Runella sp. CRIBMP TaxID=2683261 RepID=UPI001412A07A|nr:GNAT family N-acetyltransferase [Runella sp. CRIBMP]NBB19428.1 GNAT family N-acetyltransferase [Runella sp. CRIBMP]